MDAFECYVEGKQDDLVVRNLCSDVDMLQIVYVLPRTTKDSCRLCKSDGLDLDVDVEKVSLWTESIHGANQTSTKNNEKGSFDENRNDTVGIERYCDTATRTATTFQVNIDLLARFGIGFGENRRRMLDQQHVMHVVPSSSTYVVDILRHPTRTRSI